MSLAPSKPIGSKGRRFNFASGQLDSDESIASLRAEFHLSCDQSIVFEDLMETTKPRRRELGKVSQLVDLCAHLWDTIS